MITKELVDYVQKTFEDGHAIGDISPALVGQGWNDADIKEAAQKATKIIAQKKGIPMPPVAPSRQDPIVSSVPASNANSAAGTKNGPAINSKASSLSAAQVLLYLGGMIVILAGVIYVGINWSAWGPGGRILAILIPTLFCYGVGTQMWFSGTKKDQGMVFLVVGSLLFPLFLTVAFKESSLFTNPYGIEFNLAVSSITFAAYLLCGYIFKKPVWAFMYHIAGLFAFYNFLRVMSVESIFMKVDMAWYFLIIGTLYILLANLYEKIDQSQAAEYSNAIGALVLGASFFRIFAESFSNKPSLAWILILFGLAYFALGAFYEKRARAKAKYAHAPYVIGAALVFVSLLRLGMNGDLLKAFQPNTSMANLQDITGWSIFFVGIIYLLVAYVLGKIKIYQLKEGSRFKDLFDLVAPVWILGALFFLGLGGHKPFYETALLVGSLAFIFGSIPTKSSPYLAIGTIFLVIYIFSIGGEYFQNQVGWPLTLFFAGLLSMGVGVAIERVRRKYFGQALAKS